MVNVFESISEGAYFSLRARNIEKNSSDRIINRTSSILTFNFRV